MKGHRIRLVYKNAWMTDWTAFVQLDERLSISVCAPTRSEVVAAAVFFAGGEEAFEADLAAALDSAVEARRG